MSPSMLTFASRAGWPDASTAVSSRVRNSRSSAVRFSAAAATRCRAAVRGAAAPRAGAGAAPSSIAPSAAPAAARIFSADDACFRARLASRSSSGLLFP